MVVLSVLRSTQTGCKVLRAPLTSLLCNLGPKDPLRKAAVRYMGHGRKMAPYPTRFEWTLFKDHFHFYLMLGVLPLAMFATYINVTSGKTELVDIPDGYVPQHEEYYRHPISRMFAKWFHSSPEKCHEIRLHYMQIEVDKARMNALERKVKTLMAERGDYQGWYYVPGNTRRVFVAHEHEQEYNDLKSSGKF